MKSRTVGWTKFCRICDKVWSALGFSQENKAASRSDACTERRRSNQSFSRRFATPELVFCLRYVDSSRLKPTATFSVSLRETLENVQTPASGESPVLHTVTP